MFAMPNHRPLRLVDSGRAASVSFAPPDPALLGPRGRTPTRAPIAVGPGRAMPAAPNRSPAEQGAGVSYPIQPGKVQPPGLRDETLARARLLDWLEAKIHSRVIFVIADAGYGKTTLLADFSRRTRLRTMWYRLDEDDRDWVGFLSHLVAAGREHDPGFAPRTASILRSLEPGGPTRDDAVAAFLAELPSIASEGAALIFDDFHLADEINDVRLIAREIVARAPERLSIVFASRRQPSVPVSKLRAIGELAELGIADLRFSDSELEQLFRETYGRPLEPDVLTELAKRTEGWAASLTLVQAALRERSPAETRSFVRSLSGARDELHDYLAEEVVGDLPKIHQQFLMRTSVLQVVTPELAQVATNLDAIEVQSLILESERLGLLGRRPNRRSTAQRYHPLVREFLEERLRRDVGGAGVDELHIAVARWAESTDWRTAAHHFASARRWSDLQRVLDTHVETIVASGAFSTALELIQAIPDTSESATAHVIRSRAANAEGDYQRGAALANRAAELAPTSDVAIGTLLAARMLQGRYVEAVSLVDEFSRIAKSPLMRSVAIATRALVEASVEGELGEAGRICEELAEHCRLANLAHFEGVSWLNAALIHAAAARMDRAKACGAWAIDALAATSSRTELAAARSLEATLVAWTGRPGDARQLFESTLSELEAGPRVEFVSEYAEAEALFGDADRAAHLLAARRRDELNSSTFLVRLIEAFVAFRKRDFAQAFTALCDIELGHHNPLPGYQSRLLATRALAAVALGHEDALVIAQHAIDAASRQGARTAEAVGRLALGYETHTLRAAIAALPEACRFALSIGAELVAARLSELDDDCLAIVEAEAERAPERWSPVLRHEIASGGETRVPAARLLDRMGSRSDVALLRAVARDRKVTGTDKGLGRGLARRIAPRVLIHDLGRVTVAVGSETAFDAGIRRKVLALLCFLLTRPRWAATREEVMEALWPDLDPAGAVNSLNQSVYFLRRVFESEYSEETTPGYVHQDSDLLWLDRELVRARSADCAELVSEFDRTGNAAAAVALSEQYTGKFALDFAYEDWAADFREWLHVSYLRVVETQMRADADSGTFARGISIARRALEVEPRNDELELSLLRLLRSSGAHSAAAEQYARYANLLRNDLGVEAPSFETV
jgi:DNA-binding SARP family transcriptional activator